MASVEELVKSFSDRDLPVLRRSMIELNQLRRREDDITARDISRVILHDPLMTLRLLRFFQAHRRDKESTEITTIEHVIMMRGTGSFFRNFSKLALLEETLARSPEELSGFIERDLTSASCRIVCEGVYH